MIVAITSDIDFASDNIIEEAFKNLLDIPLTIFQTHKSNYLGNANNKLWELEIHPNFCYGSSQGNTIDEIITNVSSIKHDGFGYRCHRYYSSNDIVEIYSKKYVYSSNVCTDLEMVKPFKERCGIVEIPIFMEDGGYLKYHNVPLIDDVVKIFKPDGVYVFNFHPFHIAMNSSNFSLSRKMKDKLGDNYKMIDADFIRLNRNTGYGISDFLSSLICYCKENNVELATLKEIYERYKDNRI